MKRRGGFRPNAMPAKWSALGTHGERIEERSVYMRSDMKTPRMMTKDLCDFCLKYAYVYKRQLGLRLRGKKFMCEVCRFEDGRQEEAKKIAALPCWQRYGGWARKK